MSRTARVALQQHNAEGWQWYMPQNVATKLCANFTNTQKQIIMNFPKRKFKANQIIRVFIDCLCCCCCCCRCNCYCFMIWLAVQLCVYKCRTHTSSCHSARKKVFSNLSWWARAGGEWCQPSTPHTQTHTHIHIWVAMSYAQFGLQIRLLHTAVSVYVNCRVRALATNNQRCIVAAKPHAFFYAALAHIYTPMHT